MEAKPQAPERIPLIATDGGNAPPIKQLANKALENAASPRKRGRPPGSGKKVLAPEQAEPGPDAGAPVAPIVDVALVKKTVESVLGAIDGALMRKVYTVAKRTTRDEDMSKELAITAGMTKDELAVISECSGVVCQKYNILGQYAPEAMLLAVMTGYSLRVVFVFRKLNAIVEAQAAAAKKAEPANAVKP